MKITFYNPAGIRTRAGIERQQGIGTAERNVIEIAREFAAMGEDVSVFANTTIDFEDHGVQWIGDFSRPHECDVLVIYRIPRIPHNIKAKAIIFSSQDDIDCPAMEGFKDHAALFDRIVPLSQYHADRLIAEGANPGKIRICPVGMIFDPVLAALALQPREHAVIYASAPFKGLPLLATLWPKIHERHPDLELRVFSDMHMHGSPENDSRFLPLYNGLKRMPNVKVSGSIPQHELHREMAKCELMLYPNFYPETFGNSVQESIAMLCPVVTSNIGALPEVVGPAGIIVDGDPKTAEYRIAFLAAVDRALETIEELRELAMQRTKEIPSYHECAVIFRRIIEEVFP